MNQTAELRPTTPQFPIATPQFAIPTPERMEGTQMAASILTILGRIEMAVETETTAINSDPAFDIKASNARKGRCLYELNRAMKGISLQQLGDDAREAVVRLRHKLVANEAAIRAHLSAVNEVATLLQDVIHHSEADGTYSTYSAGGSATP